MVLNKDTLSPNISIISPITDQFLKLTAHDFIVEIFDVNLDSMWYSFNNILNLSFNTNTTFNETYWESVLDGPVNITFYANDSIGRISSSSIEVIKDSISPTINILAPLEGEKFTSTPPQFNIQVNDVNLERIMYSINNEERQLYVDGNLIDQSTWDNLEGMITVTIYAYDKAGNIETKTIRIIKEPGFSPLLFIFIIILAIASVAIPGLFIRRSRIKLEEKDSEIEVLKKEKSKITEEDIIISKEKHICLVHKGFIQGFNFNCPNCGAFYCIRCYEAIVKLENICWSCQGQLDLNVPKIVPKTEGKLIKYQKKHKEKR